MMKQLEMIDCPKCGDDFPKLRKELYNYHTCVNCSTTEAVVGITTVEGTGDHTYNDLIIMPQSRAIAIAKAEAAITGKKALLTSELLDLDREETEASASVKEKDKVVIEDDPTELLLQANDNKEQQENFGQIKGIDY